ncbi:MAG: hypothetical protein OXC99_11475 [Chloroflexi bacterium]|nr:hypothetical protein [Chloroflexota bacterium]
MPGHPADAGTAADTVRTGDPLPWGTAVEYAFRAGCDGLGRVAVHHVVERGCAAMAPNR